MIKGYKIVDADEVMSRTEKYHKDGAEPGVYVGYEAFNGLYSMKLGSCTDWTGAPQSGKTQLLMQLLHYTSVAYGWKHTLYVPDMGELEEIMDILIHIHTGKTIDPRYANRISLQEMFSANNWLLDNFFILDAEPEAPPLTSVQFWEYVCETRCQTGVIDSWKDMSHDYSKHGGNYARYLSEVLPRRNALAQRFKKHFHTVIHPKNARRGKNGDKQNVDVDDMEGGAQWNNSGKSIIGCNRDTFDTTIIDIDILKAKPRIVGKRGMLQLEYDVVRGQYFEKLPGVDQKYYAGELKEHILTRTPEFFEPPDRYETEAPPF